MNTLEVEGLVSEKIEAVLFRAYPNEDVFMSWSCGHGAILQDSDHVKLLLTSKREICIQEGPYEIWIEFSVENAQKIHEWYKSLATKA
jgi:hypothetical protein